MCTWTCAGDRSSAVVCRRVPLASLSYLVDNYMQFRHPLKACLFDQGCGTQKDFLF